MANFEQIENYVIQHLSHEITKYQEALIIQNNVYENVYIVFR